MQHRSPNHQARHPYSVDPAYDYQVSFSTQEFVPETTIHTPPYSSIYETSSGFAPVSPPKHQARHPYYVDPAYDHGVSFSTYEMAPQRLIHAPPHHSGIYETSNDFAAIRPEPRHGKVVRGDGYERAHQDVDAEVDEFIKYEQKKVRVVDYDRAGEHAAYGGNSKVSRESVNAEADGFIRHAHERFLRKPKSVNYG